MHPTLLAAYAKTNAISKLINNKANGIFHPYWINISQY